MILQESMVIPSLYTTDEQAIIERWIERCPVYPERDELNDANRVAEIALSSVQRKLPQGISIGENGSKITGRKIWGSPVQRRNSLLAPIHLFEINWNDSHIRWVWPETYYATLLPGYNLYAVTLSLDSDDSYGYSDMAIGCFKVDESGRIAEKAGRIVQAWWQFQFQEWRQWAWKAVLKPGLIDARLALLLRNEVWSKGKTSRKVVAHPFAASCST